MKWRKLLELATSSSPPGADRVRIPVARRRAMFEALENRKLFAVDVAEAIDGEVMIYEFLPTEDAGIAESGMAEVRTFELEATKVADETGELYSVAFEEFAGDPKVMMMSFRGAEVGSEVGDEVQTFGLAVEDADSGSPWMYMTGAVEDSEVLQVRTLEHGDELAVTSELVDGVIAEDDLIFYTLSPEVPGEDVGQEVEVTSLDDALPPEDVNGDGNVTPLDMLLVINALNGYGPLTGEETMAAPEVAVQSGNGDINRDGFVTPLDALWLTNFFNSGFLLSATLAADEDSRLMLPDTSAEGIVAESPEESLVAADVARIRNPEDTVSSDDAVPLIDDLAGDEIWERV